MCGLKRHEESPASFAPVVLFDPAEAREDGARADVGGRRGHSRGMITRLGGTLLT